MVHCIPKGHRLEIPNRDILQSMKIIFLTNRTGPDEMPQIHLGLCCCLPKFSVCDFYALHLSHQFFSHISMISCRSGLNQY